FGNASNVRKGAAIVGKVRDVAIDTSLREDLYEVRPDDVAKTSADRDIRLERSDSFANRAFSEKRCVKYALRRQGGAMQKLVTIFSFISRMDDKTHQVFAMISQDPQELPANPI